MSQHPLARVGRGRATHVFDSATGRTLCEVTGGWNWLKQDGEGTYSDKTNLSDVTPLATSGWPTCTYCQEALAS
jgi:hypothetical protein